MELSPRKKNILASVIERYIATGEPVGSKIICDSLSVSSATVRNEMAELSAIGLLEQPHTSAGRIPSEAGYRYYIDNILKTAELSEIDKFRIESRFDRTSGDPLLILRQIGDIVSQITGCTLFISSPTDSSAVIKRTELVPVGSHTAMIIIQLSTGVIKSTVCKGFTNFGIKTVELFYNITNAYFVNKHTKEITTALIQTVTASLGDKIFEMLPLLVTLKELAQGISSENIIISGQENLLNHPDFGNDAQAITDLIKNKAVLTKLFNRTKKGVSVSIGKENRYRALENVSIITSDYSVSGRVMGSVSLMCPVKTDYSKLISTVKYTGEFAGNALSRAIEE